jgi:hypothetical protein
VFFSKCEPFEKAQSIDFQGVFRDFKDVFGFRIVTGWLNFDWTH